MKSTKEKRVTRIKIKEDETVFHPGVVPLERRKYPRFSVDLPIRYKVGISTNRNGRAMNLSEGGMLIHSLDQMEIGQNLKSRLVFILDSEMNTIETDAEVIWRDIYFNKAWGDHRCGVRFLDISAKDKNRLKEFLTDLSPELPH